MSDEAKLLHEFAARRSETAFAAIVHLHLNLVFATALRQLGDRGLAEEVTQNVFLTLSQKAPSLRGHSTLAGWLYQTTLNQSRQRLRSEFRRHRREETAATLALAPHEGESIWSTILPLLDEALLTLQDQDRLALLLHYMEGRPFCEVGAALGVGEDAARKRINRVLDDLTGWFRKRGFILPAGVLIAALSLEGQAASALLASAITAAYAAAPTAAGLSALAIFMASTQLKIIGGVALVLALSAPFVLRKSDPPSAVAIASQTAPQPADPISPPAKILAAPVLAATPPRNFFERINEGDKDLPMLPHEQAEAFLALNRTNAESLLTAYRVTHDLEYLRRAATNFPASPSVLFRVVAHDAFPGQRRAWIDQFKNADPDNSLASYLSANDHFEKKEYEAAYKDIATAAQQPDFNDYANEHRLSLEEIYLNSGHSVAEAKALAMAAVELPDLHILRDTAGSMLDLAKTYRAAGDNASADALIQQGLGLANRLESVQSGGVVLGDLLGLVLERRFLQQLDPSKSYPFVQGPVPDRLNQFDQREQTIRENSQLFTKWIATAPETDIVTYFDRSKLYGESAAIEWLKQRAGPP